MEKRLFIALILSFIVISASNYFFAPKTNPNLVQDTQTSEPQEDVFSKTKNSDNVQKMNIDSKAITNDIIDEEIIEFTNEYYKAVFTTKGGTLVSLSNIKNDYTYPITRFSTIEKLDNVNFALNEHNSQEVIFTYLTGGIKVIKKYFFINNEISANISYINQTDESQEIDLALGVYEINTELFPETSKSSREQTLYEYSILSNDKVYRKPNATKFSKKHDKSEEDSIQWMGFRDRYYAAIFDPDFDITGYEIKHKGESVLNFYLKPDTTQLQPKSQINYTLRILPTIQNASILDNYDNDYDKILVYSRFGLIDILGKFFLFFIEFLHNIVKNWGVAIIITSIAINLATYPLTKKSMVSMKKMQALQPKLTALKEKHKNNPQKLSKEMGDMYRIHGVNPIGGCLPMLLQMPIFFALYSVLWRSYHLKGADFLWIKDLGEPDRLILLDFQIPFIGNEINILPILMMGIMFFQQKLSSKNMVATDPQQIQQQKIMQTVIPLLLGVLFYKFASGLTLYFTVLYLMSTFTQWRLSKVKFSV